MLQCVALQLPQLWSGGNTKTHLSASARQARSSAAETGSSAAPNARGSTAPGLALEQRSRSVFRGGVSAAKCVPSVGSVAPDASVELLLREHEAKCCVVMLAIRSSATV